MSLLLSRLRRAESLNVLTATQLALIPPEYPFLALESLLEKGLATYLPCPAVGHGGNEQMA